MNSHLASAGLLLFAFSAWACDRSSEPPSTVAATPSATAAARPTTTITATATVLASPTSVSTPECPTGLTSGNQGQLRLTISPARPRPGDVVTVTGDGVAVAGTYRITVTDLDEREYPVGDAVVGSDLQVRATFTMPGYPPRQPGVISIARCVVVAIPFATGDSSMHRLVTEYFPRSEPD